MEKTYNPALIQRTQRYMETHSISQNQFAAKVNLSSAALSSYLNQKYKGSVEAVERQLSEFFKLDEEAEAAAEKTASLLPRAAYVPTSISEDVCQSIRFAQLEHCMVVLHGDAGVGKSKGAQKFLHDHPTNAVGISITPSTGTLNGSIKLLARALRVPECRNKMDQMMALRSRLDGTNWVIVIDEAQHLKYAALEEIRSLTDDNPMTGEHGVGVVLIGNSEVYSRLQGRQQAQFAQLFSRIRMQREYTTRKVKEDDVRKLFPVLAEQDARKEMDFLLSVCRSPWGIRGAMNLYTNAASANDVSYENLYRMAAHMGIGMLGQFEERSFLDEFEVRIFYCGRHHVRLAGGHLRRSVGRERQPRLHDPAAGRVGAVPLHHIAQPYGRCPPRGSGAEPARRGI